MVPQPPAPADRKAPNAQATPEDLIRRLLSQLPAAASTASCSDFGPAANSLCREEIIYDAVLDGAHYLLIRLAKPAHPPVQLSPREQEIVRMVAQGHPNKVIAGVLNISSWTVCTHLRRIFAKLGVGSRAAMVARMMENGSGRDSKLTPAVTCEPAKEGHRLLETGATLDREQCDRTKSNGRDMLGMRASRGGGRLAKAV
jgi:two-component system, NarL family, nitrate/nitrite response regulator NarL